MPAIRSGWGIMKTPKNLAGFTLVEMLVVMAIFGIIAALSMPSFRDFALRRQISAQVSDLTSALRLARSEAIKRGREVSLCPTHNPNDVKPRCVPASDWARGYLIFIGSLQGNDQYIRVQQPYGAGSAIHARDAAGRRSVVGAIRFFPNGVLKDGGARTFVFAPALPESDKSYKSLSRKVCLSATGVLAPCK